MKLSTESKKLAYYLDTFADVPLTEFTSLHPYGFLVERSNRFLDKSDASQFFTQVLDDQVIMKRLTREAMQTDFAEARVIEIRKRKSDAESEFISIGRSPLSDIVISNKLVSRTHAHLSFIPSGQTCYLVDTGAANGTFINGEKLTPNKKYQLTSNDEMSFGPEIKFFYFSSEAFHSFISKLGVSQTDV